MSSEGAESVVGGRPRLAREGKRNPPGGPRTRCVCGCDRLSFVNAPAPTLVLPGPGVRCVGMSTGSVGVCWDVERASRRFPCLQLRRVLRPTIPFPLLHSAHAKPGEHLRPTLVNTNAWFARHTRTRLASRGPALQIDESSVSVRVARHQLRASNITRACRNSRALHGSMLIKSHQRQWGSDQCAHRMRSHQPIKS